MCKPVHIITNFSNLLKICFLNLKVEYGKNKHVCEA